VGKKSHRFGRPIPLYKKELDGQVHLLVSMHPAVAQYTTSEGERGEKRNLESQCD
jgi:hypothetical protein